MEVRILIHTPHLQGPTTHPSMNPKFDLVQCLFATIVTQTSYAKASRNSYQTYIKQIPIK